MVEEVKVVQEELKPEKEESVLTMSEVVRIAKEEF
jgi:hypothetical protein